MNYLTDPMYPVMMDDGCRRWVSFADVFGTNDGKSPVRVATGSRELDAALVEHWISLAQLVLAPENEDDLLDMLEDLPLRDEVVRSSEKWLPYFDAFGEVRAFQDPDAATGEQYPVSVLFVDSPGEQTVSRNSDINLPAPVRVDERIALLALAHLQRHSPAGGRGTKTSATGGGPLRTLVWFDDLRKTIVANIFPQKRFREFGLTDADPQSLFPWLSVPTGSVTPQNAPATHLYFPVIRRIYMDSGRPSAPDEVCMITGQPAERFVETVRKLPGGPDYDSTNWRHPLTPYVRRKQKGKLLSYPKLAATVQGRVAWRGRVGLFQAGGTVDEEGVAPATIISDWHEGGRCSDLGLTRVNVWAYGHACDNAKVTSWVDGRISFLSVPEVVRDAVEFELAQSTEKAVNISLNLRRSLRSAYYSAAAQKKLTFDFLNERIEQFWLETEVDFERFSAKLVKDITSNGKRSSNLPSIRQCFYKSLTRCSLSIFDDVTADDLPSDPEKITTARRIMAGANAKLIGGEEG